MKKLKNALSTLALTTLLFIGIGCSDSDDNTSEGTSRLIVKMTDAPGDYDHVYIEVVDVRIKNDSDPGENGWVSIGNVEAGVYDLLELTGGITATLADTQIPSGHIGQIRLILGSENSVVKDGVSYTLNTPSAQQSGLKLLINETLQANVTYTFLIDFDVNQSIVVQAGNSGIYNLLPVLRITTEAVSGAITGSVVPDDVTVVASVEVGDETVSAYSNSEGVFTLFGLPSGTYDVTITPVEDSGYDPVVVPDVEVTNGETTDIGEISLE